MTSLVAADCQSTCDSRSHKGANPSVDVPNQPANQEDRIVEGSAPSRWRVRGEVGHAQKRRALKSLGSCDEHRLLVRIQPPNYLLSDRAGSFASAGPRRFEMKAEQLNLPARGKTEAYDRLAEPARNSLEHKAVVLSERGSVISVIVTGGDEIIGHFLPSKLHFPFPHSTLESRGERRPSLNPPHPPHPRMAAHRGRATPTS